MNRRIKRKYRSIRQVFKRDVYSIAKDNKAFAMMIVSTYTAIQHRRLILKIWSLLGHHHPEAYEDYCNRLMGKHLTGSTPLMKSLYFVNRELYQKYVHKIPESYAMGDALAIAYKVLKR